MRAMPEPPAAGTPTASSHGAPASGARHRPPGGRGGVWRKLRAALIIVVLLTVGLLVWLDQSITQVDALGGADAGPADTPGENWLLVGSDSRLGLTPVQRRELHLQGAEGGGTDTIMLLHIPDAGPPILVSLPRDLLVDIPLPSTDKEDPFPARNRINAAYALGGPRLQTRTVEATTGVHVDHYLEVGFGGFVGVVDAAGGVNVCLKRPIDDKRSGAHLDAGCQRLDGADALAFVRARHSSSKGDLARVRRQREVLRLVAEKVSSSRTLTDPAAVLGMARAGLESAVVDESTGPWDLLQLAQDLRRFASGNGRTATVPTAGLAHVPDVGMVVRMDLDRAQALFQSLSEGSG
jgi:LCP family protein required for cell wall assembly